MKFELKSSAAKSDLLVLLLEDGKNIPQSQKKLLDSKTLAEVEKRLREKDFNGKAGEKLVLFGDASNHKKTVLLGLGTLDKQAVLPFENAGGTAAGIAKSVKAKSVTVAVDEKNLAEFVNGFVLGSYEFTKYKKPDEKDARVETLTLISGNNAKTKEAIRFAELFEDSSKQCRDLVNTPAGSRNTIDVANLAKESAKKFGFTCKVYDEKQMEKMGCGGILGVGRGGEYPPRLIVLEYKHKSKSKNPNIVFVGKGITFDTGGLNIKPTGHIETMKLDLAGAAAVLATMSIIARSKLPGNFAGVMAMAENAVSDRSMHPGDILKAYNGKTIEVSNTDAEGRLVLADALAYAEAELKPEKMVDVATLTGAVTVALGYNISGVMGNDAKFTDEVMAAAKNARERMWVLPLDKDFYEATKGDITDTKNATDGVRAGTIMGAAFLQQFVDKVKWAHIDIGGTAWAEKPSPTTKYGGTAATIRTLWELAKMNSI